MLSYWEKNSFTNYHFIIIGSGIVGLSTALSLREKHPKHQILVLEKGHLPTGASTKNAGFACFGSLSEIFTDLQTMRKDEVERIIEMRRLGLTKLRKRIGDTNLNYEASGSFELLFKEDLHLINHLDSINKWLHPIFNKEVYSLSSKQFGFSNQVKALIKNEFEGAIDTGKMMKNLLRKCQEEYIDIINGAEVADINDKVHSAEVKLNNNTLHFIADKVVVCTNAFTKQFYPKIDLKPGRGQVLITKPIPELKVKGVFHFDEGFYYFRNVGQRILFGGGRNLAFKKEESDLFELNSAIQQQLEEYLRKIIIPNTPFEVDQRWTGIMAFGNNKLPLIQWPSKNVLLGVRLGGMGVAIGSHLGELLAEEISE